MTKENNKKDKTIKSPAPEGQTEDPTITSTPSSETDTNNSNEKSEEEKSIQELIDDLYKDAETETEETVQDMNEEIQNAVEKELKKLKDVHKNEIEQVKRNAGKEVVRIQTQAKKDIDAAKEKGTAALAKDMIELADNFKRAVDDISQDDLDNNVKLKTLYEGVKMMETLLQEAFEKHGIEKIEAEGQKFDPHKHEAMMQEESKDQDPGTVAKVIQDGYTINDKVLRNSRVSVVKKP
jgi:molecular chaperone GrpE